MIRARVRVRVRVTTSAIYLRAYLKRNTSTLLSILLNLSFAFLDNF